MRRACRIGYVCLDERRALAHFRLLSGGEPVSALEFVVQGQARIDKAGGLRHRHPLECPPDDCDREQHQTGNQYEMVCLGEKSGKRNPEQFERRQREQHHAQGESSFPYEPRGAHAARDGAQQTDDIFTIIHDPGDCSARRADGGRTARLR